MKTMVHVAAALAVDGWMAYDELAWLAEHAADARLIIEVGCWKGRSTRALADHTDGVVYAVDHWQGTPGDKGHAKALATIGREGLYRLFLKNLDAHIASGRVVPLREYANVAALAFAPQSVDLVFLDAGHTYAEVRENIQTYQPLVKPGGILCGHDYANPEHPGVTQAVNELCQKVHRAGLSIWWVRV